MLNRGDYYGRRWVKFLGILRAHFQWYLIMASLLVIDASSSLCSVAVWHEEKLFALTEEQPRRHAQRLLPMIDEALSDCGLTAAQLDGIAYGCGPGSFTGIRIAASVTQGIALALDLPVKGVSSLQAVAQAAFSASSANEVMAIMDAHMGEVFWGHFQRDGTLSRALVAEQVGSPDACISDMTNFNGILAGDGLQLPVFAELDAELAMLRPEARMMVPLVIDAWDKGLFTDAENQQPVYLRNSVAWKKLDEQPSLLKRI